MCVVCVCACVVFESGGGIGESMGNTPSELKWNLLFNMVEVVSPADL